MASIAEGSSRRRPDFSRNPAFSSFSLLSDGELALIFLPRAHPRHQALFTNQRVNHHHDGRKPKQDVEDPPAARGDDDGFGLDALAPEWLHAAGRLPGRRFRFWVERHVGTSFEAH